VNSERPIVLCGLPGAGKSTLASTLAAALERRSVDLDAVVEAETGRTIAELFADGGEVGFRAHELRALRAVLDGPAEVVVAAGGGLVTTEAARVELGARATVVYLRAELETLRRRVGAGEGRPLLDGDVAERLSVLEVARSPLYLEVADLVIDVDDRSVDDLVAELSTALLEPSR